MEKFKEILISIAVKCGAQSVQEKVGFSQNTTPEEMISQLDPLFHLAVCMAFFGLWKVVALEQEMSGGISCNVEVEFSLIINGNAEKPLHKLEIAKGTVAEIQRQLGDSSRLVTLLFYKAAPILVESYTL